MHAATSHVGNVVQIQTPAGHIYEGVFRTFSSQFQIVLEMAHRVEIGPDQKTKIVVETFVERLIFKPNDIVTLAAKDVDPEYATRDTFKTDTAISRCNGTNWLEDRELEPWDESGGLNGDPLEHSLELDSNADGWDVNEMFHKNETIYGVHSTFDQSLSGYTVQIQKKDSEEFKVQELEAEKIANEIENNPVYKERIDVENGDEEAAFAAVIRPSSNASPQPASVQQSAGGPAGPAVDKNSNSVSSSSSSSSNSSANGGTINSVSNGNNNLASNTNNSNNNTAAAMPSNTKYIVPAKRKPGQGGKLVRSTPPPLANSNNNNGGPPVVSSQQHQQQHQQQQQQQPPSPQAPHKNSYVPMMSQQQQQQQQQPPPPSSQQHGGGGMGHPPGPQYGMHTNQSPYGHVQHQQQQQQQQQQPPQHGQPSVMGGNKMNGDGRGDMPGGPPGGGGGGGSGGNMNVNNNQKPLPQRAVRQYPSAQAPVSYNEPPPSLNPQQMPGQMQAMSTKPPMHMTHPIHAVVPPHMPPPTVVPTEHVVIQQHPMAMPPPVQQQPPPPQQQAQVQAPPPQPQRTVVVRNRDMEIDNLRKFGQDFKLAPPQQQPPMPNVHQQPPPPSQQQQGPPSHSVVVQQPPPSQQQSDHSSPPSLDSSPPLVNNQSQGKMVSQQHNEPPPQAHAPQQTPMNQQQNQASQTASGMVVVPAQLSSQSPHMVQQPLPVTQQPPPQQPGQQPPVVVSPPQVPPQQSNHVGGAPTGSASVGIQNAVASTGPAGGAPTNNANGSSPSDSASANGGTNAEQKPGTATKKVFTLNPAAKPFTPRSPSTPNPSRQPTTNSNISIINGNPYFARPLKSHTSSSPHTPQTPGPAALAQGSFQPPSPHVIQQPFVMQYVVNPSSFQAAQQHPHAAQPARIRNGRQGSYRNEFFSVGTSQMQVAAATGQPLLAPNPIQMLAAPYAQAIHAQPFQAAPPFHQQYRTIYDTPQPPLQFLAATPPSTTPSPGQPHQQYHPGPQPSPAGGGPPTYQTVHHQQPGPYPISMCPMPQVVPTLYQNIPSAPQQNHHQQNLHVMHVAQHPSAQ
ncbi:ataxin-2 homolog [Anopheles nili]|uniref:ataxin-2 homolog n=1 Tax=Anopheles nili TaxID=185578 RepID=UPI00237B6B79|nr:ataxin-2 homolog [Anopheles nili]